MQVFFFDDICSLWCDFFYLEAWGKILDYLLIQKIIGEMNN